MPAGSFGPGLQATGGYLAGRSGVSQREVQDWLATACYTEVSVGSLATLAQAVSAALAAPVAAATCYGPQPHVRHADETGWYERAKRLWLSPEPCGRGDVTPVHQPARRLTLCPNVSEYDASGLSIAASVGRGVFTRLRS